ncbi:CHAT domain-containing protein [Okeania sp. KiyG1]|uniref:CHAT domain-containing protein n=1 Tax=Okeania sp. KiyG1 TaxID=2720165 RepID=UPI001F21CB54|nr:tetratricopeptide repeat protein [Okeania sp. KiyG1]
MATIPLILLGLPQPSYAQTSYSQTHKLEQLLAVNYNSIREIIEMLKQLQKDLYIGRSRAVNYNSILKKIIEESKQLQQDLYISRGRIEYALLFFQQALSLEVGDRSGKATTLNLIGEFYQSIGQPEEALKYFREALSLWEKVGDRSGKATTLNLIGEFYQSIGQPEEALKYFQDALFLWEEVGDRSGKASALRNIGAVYQSIGQPEEALKYFREALFLWEEVGDRPGKATTLNLIGEFYQSIGQPKKALKYFREALFLWEEVGDRPGKASALRNIGAVYHSIGQPEEAFKYFKGALQIIREMPTGLTKEAFFNDRTTLTLIDFLIEQNAVNEAWQLFNYAITSDLNDCIRSLDLKVKDPEAQKLINQWQQNNQLLQFLQFLYDKIKDQWSPQLSQAINQLQAETNEIAKNISNKYPEVADLFESKPKDIDPLKANIAPGTVVILPVLLTGIPNVPDSIAIFLVTRDKPVLVKKVPIDAQEFYQILREYRQQLENPYADLYEINQEKLYDYLIRPIEGKIADYCPKQLAIIATGKLRDIPFETLFDNQTNKYLLEKYPIHYLTHISGNKKPKSKHTKSLKVLAFGNPQPTKKDLPGAEAAAKEIAEMFSSKYYIREEATLSHFQKEIAEMFSSKYYIREEATLSHFQKESDGFPIVHLATHGCFQKGGCPDIGLEENTILFANKETFEIADILPRELEKTDLLVLSACQTAKKTPRNEISVTMKVDNCAGIVLAAYLFERAGVDAFIASLWNVEDETTKDITVKFYQNLLQGMTKVEALRQAKLSYAREYVSPFYWSPLILIGDGE